MINKFKKNKYSVEGKKKLLFFKRRFILNYLK